MEITENRAELYHRPNPAERLIDAMGVTAGRYKHLIRDIRAIRKYRDIERIVRTYIMKLDVAYTSLIFTWVFFMATVNNPSSLSLLNAPLAMCVSILFLPYVTAVMAHVYDTIVGVVEWDWARVVLSVRNGLLLTIPVFLVTWLIAQWIIIF